MRKILMTIFAALGLLMLGTVSAQADDTTVFADAPWTAVDTAAGGVQSTSSHSSIVDETAADATWATGEDASAAGTSLQTDNLNLEVEAGQTIAVDYALLEGASPAAGSVRLFIYYTADADTWGQAPDQVAVAPDGVDTGTLSINADGGTVGTAGLVYDTSNGGVEGTVRFTDLRVGELVSFLPAPEPDVCEWDAELLADDELCVEPDDTDDTDTTDNGDNGDDVDNGADGSDPVAVPTAIPAGDTLPKTGVNPVLAGLVGAGLLGAGGGLLALRRRRMSTF